jgi:hypothetical protein
MKGFIRVYIIVAILMGIYTAFLSINYGFKNIQNKDPLNNTFNVGPISVSGWEITHILLYVILGFLYPQNWKELMAIGVGWELVETVLGHIFVNDVNGTIKKKAYSLWWSGSVKDLFYNAFGLFIGMICRQLFTSITK